MQSAQARRKHRVHAIRNALDFALDAAAVLELYRRSCQHARGESEQYDDEAGFEQYFHRCRRWGMCPTCILLLANENGVKRTSRFSVRCFSETSCRRYEISLAHPRESHPGSS